MQTETFNPEMMGMLVVSFRGVNLSQGVQDEMPQILVVKVSFRITGVQPQSKLVCPFQNGFLKGSN